MASRVFCERARLVRDMILWGYATGQNSRIEALLDYGAVSSAGIGTVVMD
jgi:hypothetical protein